MVLQQASDRQIDCNLKLQPLTWKAKDIKSKFHRNKISCITDFGNMEEAREWREMIETDARLTEKPTDEPDFQ